MGVQGHVSPGNSEENKSRRIQGHFKELVWREDTDLGLTDKEDLNDPHDRDEARILENAQRKGI